MLGLNPWVILAVLVSFLGSNAITGIVAFNKGEQHEINLQTAATLKDVHHVSAVNNKATVLVSNAGQKVADAKTSIHADIEKTRDAYNAAKPKKDQPCVLPARLERVYDAAGTGDQTYNSTAGPGTSDEARTVSCDLAAARFLENNERDRDLEKQVDGLTEAYDNLRALYLKEFGSSDTKDNGN